jgi:hypothetical protein
VRGLSQCLPCCFERALPEDRAGGTYRGHVQPCHCGLLFLCPASRLVRPPLCPGKTFSCAVSTSATRPRGSKIASGRGALWVASGRRALILYIVYCTDYFLIQCTRTVDCQEYTNMHNTHGHGEHTHSPSKCREQERAEIIHGRCHGRMPPAGPARTLLCGGA